VFQTGPPENAFRAKYVASYRTFKF
jgi:hypothetical protein